MAVARPRAGARSRRASDVARITAGLTTSHIPAIGAAIDLGKTEEPYWKPLFAGYEWTKAWAAREVPDVVILVYNDHASAFTPEVVPTFALGCADEFKPGGAELRRGPHGPRLGHRRHEPPAAGAPRGVHQLEVRQRVLRPADRRPGQPGAGAAHRVRARGGLRGDRAGHAADHARRHGTH